MNGRFLCIDPRWDGGRPTADFLRAQGFDGVRFVAFPDVKEALDEYLGAGFEVMLVLANESGDPAQYQYWSNDHLHWTIGNEPDGPMGGASWVMTPAEYDNLWERSAILQGERWVAGMCSGDATRATPYMPGAMNEAGVCVHLYGLTPEEAGLKLHEYAYACLSPVWVGEFHPLDGYTDAEYFAEFETVGEELGSWGPVWANLYCYSDAMNDGFGLVDKEGNLK